MLGIIELVIFGVNLKLKFLFICGMIVVGIVLFFIGLFYVLVVVMGLVSIIGFIFIVFCLIFLFMIGIVISIMIGFLSIYFYGKKYMEFLVDGELKGIEVVELIRLVFKMIRKL